MSTLKKTRNKRCGLARGNVQDSFKGHQRFIDCWRSWVMTSSDVEEDEGNENDVMEEDDEDNLQFDEQLDIKKLVSNIPADATNLVEITMVMVDQMMSGVQRVEKAYTYRFKKGLSSGIKKTLFNKELNL